MSCLPPEQMPFDQESRNRAVILYPSYEVGVNNDSREVAVVFDSPKGEKHPSPALLLSEKQTVHLILHLQRSLQYVRKLAVLPLD